MLGSRLGVSELQLWAAGKDFGAEPRPERLELPLVGAWCLGASPGL